MMQVEGTRLTLEDRRELEFQIKECERRIELYKCQEDKDREIKQLRKLRRMRQ